MEDELGERKRIAEQSETAFRLGVMISEQEEAITRTLRA